MEVPVGHPPEVGPLSAVLLDLKRISSVHTVNQVELGRVESLFINDGLASEEELTVVAAVHRLVQRNARHRSSGQVDVVTVCVGDLGVFHVAE